MAESDEYGGPPGTGPPGQEEAGGGGGTGGGGSVGPPGGPPGGPAEDFFEDDFGGPPGGPPGWGPPGWRGRGGFRGGPPPRFMRGGPRGQFGPPMRGRGGFGPPPNGFGPRGPRPRGPPPGWGGDFGPPGSNGPPMGMGGPPPHWGGPPGGWDAPGMEEGGPPADEAEMEKKESENTVEKAAEDLDVDLNGEVWVETKTDSGKSYFYNARTRQTTWERPEEKDGVRVLSQEQVDKLTQKLASNEKKESEQQQQQQPDQYNMPPYGMPPPGYGGPQGYPPHQGYPPPWAQGGGQGYPPGGWGGMPPQGMDVCDWSEHTAPDGKKYYYNGKSGESVWEKPQELVDFELRQSSGGGPPGVPTQAAPVQSQPSPVISKEEAKPETPTKVQVAKAPAVIPEKAKPADKSRPVSSTPVHGTPWCVVWTGDNKAFFYNPSTKTSVWERPPDLIGRSDVTEMLKSPAQAEKMKAKNIPPGFNANPMASGGGGNNKNKKAKDDSDSDDVPAAKKKKVELVFEDELKAKEDQSANGGNTSTKSMGKNL